MDFVELILHALGRFMGEAMSKPFDLVLGRKTYDIFAAFWPHAPEEAGAKPLNHATKYVASRSKPTLEWSNSVQARLGPSLECTHPPDERDPIYSASGHSSGHSMRLLEPHVWRAPPVEGWRKALADRGGYVSQGRAHGFPSRFGRDSPHWTSLSGVIGRSRTRIPLAW
jgi:hypothetical protein